MSVVRCLQDVRDDAETPHVHGGAVGLVHRDLGRDVPGRAAVGLERVADVQLVGESEVGDADAVQLVAFCQQEVLRLQVAVDDAALVAVVERAQQRQHAALRLRLAEVLHVDDGIEELAAFHQVLHEVVVVVVLPEVAETHDVRVATQLEEDRRLLLAMRQMERADHHVLHVCRRHAGLADSLQCDVFGLVEDGAHVDRAVLALADAALALEHLADVHTRRLQLVARHRVVDVVVEAGNETDCVLHQLVRHQLVGEVAQTLDEVHVAAVSPAQRTY